MSNSIRFQVSEISKTIDSKVIGLEEEDTLFAVWEANCMIEAIN